jgi:hypothetical protein
VSLLLPSRASIFPYWMNCLLCGSQTCKSAASASW